MGPDEIPAFDDIDGGEEQQCALVLDSMSKIDFWARNLAQHPHSFRLPLVSGNFYPDFVARLTDGRVLVVEYKGQQHAEEQETADTRAKRFFGARWPHVSRSKGVFVLATMKNGDTGQLRQQLKTAISG